MRCPSSPFGRARWHRSARRRASRVTGFTLLEMMTAIAIVGAVLIVCASVSIMLALSIGGVRAPWISLPVVALFAVAAAIGAL